MLWLESRIVSWTPEAQGWWLGAGAGGWGWGAGGWGWGLGLALELGIGLGIEWGQSLSLVVGVWGGRAKEGIGGRCEHSLIMCSVWVWISKLLTEFLTCSCHFWNLPLQRAANHGGNLIKAHTHTDTHRHTYLNISKKLKRALFQTDLVTH